MQIDDVMALVDEYVSASIEDHGYRSGAASAEYLEDTKRKLLAAIAALIAAPAAPQQAEPVAQIGWADEFGNLFPMGAWKPAQRTHHDAHKVAWRPVYPHPPAAELARLRAENERLRGDNVHLRGHFERAWPDTQRYRWLRATNMEQQNILAHYAYTEMDAAIDAAMAQGDKA